MSNFLEEIENEYSRGRGRASRLSPMDWQVAETWKAEGIPLRIVLAAMGDGFKKFAEKSSRGEISSLRYFIPMVKKTFAEWQTSQIGKAPEKTIFRKTVFEEPGMKNSSFAAITASINENVEILDAIADLLTVAAFQSQNIALPEPLCCTVNKIRGEILALADEAKQQHLSTDTIETRLTELRVQVEVALIASVSDDERAKLIADTRAEYGKFTLMPDVERKVLIRKLYEKFALPELTLFAF